MDPLFAPTEAFPPLTSLINFEKVFESATTFSKMQVPFGLEDQLEVLMALPAIIETTLQLFAPKVYSFFYNKSHLRVEGTIISLVFLQIYFLFAGLFVFLFFAVNGGWAFAESIYFCQTAYNRSKCDRIITYADGKTNIELDKKP